jgi:hypothetical protein
MLLLLILHAARRIGLPLVLSEDGDGKPRWHWVP